MKKPPYFKFYVKDFVFDTASLTNEELGAYMREMINCYKSGKIPKTKSDESIFKELKSSFEEYNAICKRNRNNRLNSITNADESSTSRLPVVDEPLTTLVNQEPEPRTKNQNHIPPIIPQGVDQDLWDEFLKNRKKLKAQNTPRALNTLVSKIEELASKGYDKNNLIETANMNGWKTVYEPKVNQNTPKKEKQNEHKKSVAEEFLAELERERSADSYNGGAMLCDTRHLRQDRIAIEDTYAGDDR